MHTYIQPLLKKLAPLANFSIDSQVQCVEVSELAAPTNDDDMLGYCMLMSQDLLTDVVLCHAWGQPAF